MLKPFLTANWRYLVMLNFAVDPKVLEVLVPRGPSSISTKAEHSSAWWVFFFWIRA
jgi:hypothetical protein